MYITDPHDTDTTALFLALVTERIGTSVFVLPNGTVATMDNGLSHRGIDDSWLFIDRSTDGDFDRADWLISCNDETGKFTAENTDGEFDSDTEALAAVIEQCGLPAEKHDHLIELVARRLSEIDGA